MKAPHCRICNTDHSGTCLSQMAVKTRAVAAVLDELPPARTVAQRVAASRDRRKAEYNEKQRKLMRDRRAKAKA